MEEKACQFFWTSEMRITSLLSGKNYLMRKKWCSIGKKIRFTFVNFYFGVVFIFFWVVRGRWLVFGFMDVNTSHSSISHDVLLMFFKNDSAATALLRMRLFFLDSLLLYQPSLKSAVKLLHQGTSNGSFQSTAYFFNFHPPSHLMESPISQQPKGPRQQTKAQIQSIGNKQAEINRG